MELARERQAVVRKPRGTGAKKTVNSGKAKLNAAADRLLEEKSEEIAKSLLSGIFKGNATSAKLLFALAEGQIDCEDEGVMQRVCSLAEQLAAEPEWVCEANEAAAESI
jgi:hypothetical protein